MDSFAGDQADLGATPPPPASLRSTYASTSALSPSTAGTSLSRAAYPCSTAQRMPRACSSIAARLNDLDVGECMSNGELAIGGAENELAAVGVGDRGGVKISEDRRRRVDGGGSADEPARGEEAAGGD